MPVDAFAATYSDAVERSFRDDAIRTAILIDDQFPDYVQMQDAKIADFRDLERAKSLYTFLHRRGLLCDVLNWRKPEDTDHELVEKVRKSDLVVLDYQLGTGGPKAALQILRHLAESPHFNLVVLYTSDTLTTVSLAAAAAMRGLPALPANAKPSAELLDEAAAALEDFQDIDAAGLIAYIKDGVTPWKAALQAALTEAEIDLKNLPALIHHVARRWLDRLFDGYEAKAQLLDLRCDLGGEELWIQSGSCFVAIVKKGTANEGEEEGAFVWRRLGAALRSWQPNFYRLILSEIQNALELEAIADHEAWLDDNLCLGLGLYLLEDDGAARGERAADDIAGFSQSLIDRFVDLIRRRLSHHGAIAETAAALLNGKLGLPLSDAVGGESARRTRARELAHVGPDQEVDWTDKVLPSVNAFMVSDEFRGGHLTTGTVIRDERENHWLVVSPSCDLVPRADGPILIQLMRLSKISSAEKFTVGDKVAVHSEGQTKLFRALSETSRQPSLKTLYLPNGTRIERSDGQESRIYVRGWFADLTGAAKAPPDAKAKGKAPAGEQPGAMESAQFTVVSQLRGSFATRFLMLTGQHQSRIGVDFVDP
jgi:hypothetical protein